MLIAYLQKVSLQDFPDTLSCIIFLGGCNFRCPVCYNSEILDLDKELVSQEEIFDFLEKRRGKLEGVVITGGEPLINQEIEDFLRKIKEKEYKIKLDTNGANPELLKKVIDEGLIDYIAMDVKSSKKNYDVVSGVRVDVEKIEESMRLISESGIDFEFRTTVVPFFEEGEIKKIAEWIGSVNKEAKFFIQPFVPVEGRLIDKELEKYDQTSSEVLERAKYSAEEFLVNVYVRA